MNAKKAVKRGGAALGEGAQAGAKRFITAGGGRKAVEQRAQIKASTPRNDRKSLPATDFGENLPGAAGVLAGRQLAIDASDINEVMRDAASRRQGKLGRPDIQPSIELNGIAIEDFSLERFGEKERKLALACAGGSEHGNQRPLREMGVNRHEECLSR